MLELTGEVHQRVMGSGDSCIPRLQEWIGQEAHSCSERVTWETIKADLRLTLGLQQGRDSAPLRESPRALYKGHQHQLQTRTAIIVQPHERRLLPSPHLGTGRSEQGTCATSKVSQQLVPGGFAGPDHWTKDDAILRFSPPITRLQWEGSLATKFLVNSEIHNRTYPDGKSISRRKG